MSRIPPKVRAEIRRKKRKKALYLVIGFFLILLPIRALLGEKGLISTQRKKAEVRELERKVETLTGKNQRLVREIEDLREGGLAIEKIAREQLGMALPGEFVFHLPSGKPPPSPSRSRP